MKYPAVVIPTLFFLPTIKSNMASSVVILTHAHKDQSPVVTSSTLPILILSPTQSKLLLASPKHRFGNKSRIERSARVFIMPSEVERPRQLSANHQQVNPYQQYRQHLYRNIRQPGRWRQNQCL